MHDDERSSFLDFAANRTPALMRMAYALTANSHEAEDLVQGALEKAVIRWRKIDDPESYVTRVIHNDFVSLRRRAWWRRESTDCVPDIPDVTDGYSQIDLQQSVIDALMLLAPRQRAIVVLRYLEDLDEREVARILGCSISTVSSQLSRALNRLRALCPGLLADSNDPRTNSGVGT